MADLEFKVAVKRRDPVTFTLEGDDHVYSFLPPKQASVVMPLLYDVNEDDDMAAARVVMGWLDKGLSDEDQKRVAARLADPADDLDVPDLKELITSLQEFVGGRPTT